uniref:Uncharacterized protein n=1 Tax=Solanum bukasovii TaxID=172263 RepID=A0A7S9DHL5_9SOLN|nr:hypothetical protein [Solanum bukasovii]
MVTPPWEEPLPSCLIGGASIHQRRLKVLSEPCWIVTHHTALKPNLWWIPGDKVKTQHPLPHTLRCSSPLLRILQLSLLSETPSISLLVVFLSFNHHLFDSLN